MNRRDAKKVKALIERRVRVIGLMGEDFPRFRRDELSGMCHLLATVGITLNIKYGVTTTFEMYYTDTQIPV